MVNIKKINKAKKSDDRDPKAVAEDQAKEREAEVLYQKMGEKWYAFSVVDDEVYLGAISDEQIRELQNEKK